MRQFQIDVEIAAPPQVTWAVMRDVERWPEWTASVSSVRLLDRGPLRVGSRAVIRQPKLPPARWQVTALDESGRSFTWESWAPGVRVIGSHSVEARGRGSRAKLTLRFTGVFAWLLARITGGLNDRYLALEAQGLKRRSEDAS